MKTPSINKLALVFSDPKKAKEILQMTRQELMVIPAVQWRMKNCINPPRNYDLVLTALNAIDSKVYGVESIKSEKGEFASYINVGDVYKPTVIYYQNTYRVKSIGDFVEMMEKQGVKFK